MRNKTLLTSLFLISIIHSAVYAQDRAEDVEGTGTDQGNPSALAPAPKNTLEMIKSAGFARNATPQVLVNGCTKSSTFQTIYGKPPAPGCNKKLKMGEPLLGVMEKRFPQCLKVASGVTGTIESGRIFHSGVQGDPAHQKGGSLHNLGLAIDASAIEVGGTLYNYADKSPASASFFSKFRKCWGNAVNEERKGCLRDSKSGNAPGTVGDEDSRHKYHLHLSVPLCPDKARALGIKRAFIEAVLGAEAFASEPASNAEEDSVKSEPTRYQSINLKNGAIARIKQEDTGGEPVSVNAIVAVELKCAGEESFKALSTEIEVCAFDLAKYKADANALVLQYRTSVMIDGVLACRKSVKKSIPISCPRR